MKALTKLLSVAGTIPFNGKDEHMNSFKIRCYVKLQAWLSRLGVRLPAKIMYIGGSDTLPPPLTKEEEALLLARLPEGDQKAVAKLIEHNLRQPPMLRGTSKWHIYP